MFGCCDDNVTEATGPDHEGCKEMEETTMETVQFTTFETTTTSSETEEEISTVETSSTSMAPTEDCNNTTYRCCPDGETPAKGPGEIVFLTSLFFQFARVCYVVEELFSST